MNSSPHKYTKNIEFEVCVEYAEKGAVFSEYECAGYFSEKEANAMLNDVGCTGKASFPLGVDMYDCEVRNMSAFPEDLRLRLTEKAEKWGKVRGFVVRRRTWLYDTSVSRRDDFDHTANYQLCVPFRPCRDGNTKELEHQILGGEDEKLDSCYKISSQTASDFLKGENCRIGERCKLNNVWAHEHLLFDLIGDTKKFGTVVDGKENAIIRSV